MLGTYGEKCGPKQCHRQGYICTGCASASREGLMTESNTSLGQTVPVLTQSVIKDFRNTADTDLLVLKLHVLLQQLHICSVLGNQMEQGDQDTSGSVMLNVSLYIPSQRLFSTTYCVILDGFLNFLDFQAPPNNSKRSEVS